MLCLSHLIQTNINEKSSEWKYIIKKRWHHTLFKYLKRNANFGKFSIKYCDNHLITINYITHLVISKNINVFVCILFGYLIIARFFVGLKFILYGFMRAVELSTLIYAFFWCFFRIRFDQTEYRIFPNSNCYNFRVSRIKLNMVIFINKKDYIQYMRKFDFEKNTKIKNRKKCKNSDTVRSNVFTFYC